MKKVNLIIIILIVSFPFVEMLSQHSEKKSTPNTEVLIPDEILTRIPPDYITELIEGRQRVLLTHHPSDSLLTFYEEIGMSKSIIDKVPDEELYRFLGSVGYIETSDTFHHGHEHNSVNKPPSPKQLMSLLFTLAFLIFGLSVLAMLLTHIYKKKELEVIIKSLENEKEIPFSLLAANRERNHLKWAILFLLIGVSIVLLSIFEILPIFLSIVPFSISIAYFILIFLHNRWHKEI